MCAQRRLGGLGSVTSWGLKTEILGLLHSLQCPYHSSHLQQNGRITASLFSNKVQRMSSCQHIPARVVRATCIYHMSNPFSLALHGLLPHTIICCEAMQHSGPESITTLPILAFSCMEGWMCMQPGPIGRCLCLAPAWSLQVCSRRWHPPAMHSLMQRCSAAAPPMASQVGPWVPRRMRWWAGWPQQKRPALAGTARGTWTVGQEQCWVSSGFKNCDTTCNFQNGSRARAPACAMVGAGGMGKFQVTCRILWKHEELAKAPYQAAITPTACVLPWWSMVICVWMCVYKSVCMNFCVCACLFAYAQCFMWLPS